MRITGATQEARNGFRFLAHGTRSRTHKEEHSNEQTAPFAWVDQIWRRRAGHTLAKFSGTVTPVVTQFECFGVPLLYTPARISSPFIRDTGRRERRRGVTPPSPQIL